MLFAVYHDCFDLPKLEEGTISARFEWQARLHSNVAEHVPYEEYTEEIAKEKAAKTVFESSKPAYSILLEEENGGSLD